MNRIRNKGKVLFFERWLIKWAMGKLKQLSPYMDNVSYSRLERYGIADFKKENEEIYYLPL